MVAHEVIGGGVAQRIVELGRALRSVNMMAIQPISALSPGRSNCSGQSRRKAGMASRARRSARLGPNCDLDDERERSVALVADRELISAARPSSECRSARHERRDDAVGADVAIGFGARLDCPKNGMGPEPRIKSKLLTDRRRDLGLKSDAGRAAPGPSRHSSPSGSGQSKASGLEGQFDVAAEIAFVTRCAGGAMRTFRQFVKSAHTRLCAAAAGAQQIRSPSP